MTSPWTYTGDVARVAQGQTVTLIEATCFCISERNGDILPGTPEGLFLLDTRFVSGLVLRVAGLVVEPLGVAVDGPFEGTFFGRVASRHGHADGELTVLRKRTVGRGLAERVTVRNHGRTAMRFSVELEVQSDFADLFAVKEGRDAPTGAHSRRHEVGRLQLGFVGEGLDRGTEISFSLPADVEGTTICWVVELDHGAEWTACVEVSTSIDGTPVVPHATCADIDGGSGSAARFMEWQEAVPVVETGNEALDDAVARSVADLGSLRLVDPEHPDDAIVAAGAPWYMTVFGRDSLITAYMSLIVDPDIALGVLRTLARLQGKVTNPDTEEEPGKILHEIRFHEKPSWSFADGTVYYGTVDASPLFVMLLGELRRWGLAASEVEALLPHADRALEWITSHGDRDGDGYVEYQRLNASGLENQGWKDSWDGVTFADGTLPEGPIALCEVQGYTYSAYLARAYFAEERGQPEVAAHWRERAESLKEQFNRDFWLPERGCFALALDGEKRPVDALASNMGHCLWTGIVDTDKAASVAAHLMSPEMFSGWGVRTLASNMGAYNPVSYHNGSIWPHDNALVAAGLVRYGFTAEAQRIMKAMLDVSRHHSGRLPELFSGLDRSELSVPAAYPTSCIPQAWSAASPLMFLRILLRFDPWVPHGRLWVAPALPDWLSRLDLRNIPLDGGRVSVRASSQGVMVEGLDPEVELVLAGRNPLTAAF